MPHRLISHSDAALLPVLYSTPLSVYEDLFISWWNCVFECEDEGHSPSLFATAVVFWWFLRDKWWIKSTLWHPKWVFTHYIEGVVVLLQMVLGRSWKIFVVFKNYNMWNPRDGIQRIHFSNFWLWVFFLRKFIPWAQKKRFIHCAQKQQRHQGNSEEAHTAPKVARIPCDLTQWKKRRGPSPSLFHQWDQSGRGSANA